MVHNYLAEIQFLLCIDKCSKLQHIPLSLASKYSEAFHPLLHVNS